MKKRMPKRPQLALQKKQENVPKNAEYILEEHIITKA